jgi:hypothetical protein
MVLSLSQIVLPDEITGEPRPLIGFTQFKKMVETYLGIKIDEESDEQEALKQMQMEMEQQMQMQGQQQGQQQQGSPQSLNINPNIPGANLNGTTIGGGV